MASREERMAQRMRGAQRHQVEDVSFGPLFPVLEEAPQPMGPPPVPSSIPRSTANASNISVKRARLVTDPSPLGPAQPVMRRRSPRNQSMGSQSSQGREDPYAMPDTSNESIETARSAGSNARSPASASTQARRTSAGRRPQIVSPPSAPALAAEDELESLPDPTPRSLLKRPLEEVTESPANAPGSGHRRRVAAMASSSVAQSTARLQEIVDNEDELTADLGSFASSSPLVRKSRRSNAFAFSRSTRSSDVGPSPLDARIEEADELSPEQAKGNVSSLQVVEEEEDRDDEAMDVDHDETTALLRVGQDMLRRSMVETSPILDSVPFDLVGIPQFSPLEEKKPREQQAEADANNAEEINDLQAANRPGKRKPPASLPSAPAEPLENVSPPKRRGRRKRQEPEQEPAEEVIQAQQPKRKGRRKKEPPPVEIPDPEPEPEEQEPEPAEEEPEPESEVVGQEPRKRRGSKEKPQQEPQAEEADVESEGEEEAASKPRRRSKRKSKDSEPDSPSPREETAEEVVQPVIRKRGRKRKLAGAEPEPEPEQQEQEPDDAEPELEPDIEYPPSPEAEAEAPAPRPSKKSRKSKDQSAQAPTKRISRTAARKKNKSLPQQIVVSKRGGGGSGIPITVQRFTHTPWMLSDTEDDILHAAIPFASRSSSVNIVDVLSQVCEELLSANLSALEQKLSDPTTGDKQAKSQLKIKYKALEAYREELQTRLLEHAVALDNLYTVQKRVRAVQKEKISLRDEILELKKEREDVALRMDVVRMGFERERDVALHQIALSTSLHNVDLALEAGADQTAASLSPAEKKLAGLKNLELVISRVAEEATSGGGGGGGTLRCIREFNAFLERAAVALEGR